MSLTSPLRHILRIAFPLLLAAAILYWMYRGMDFLRMWTFMQREMDWTWMLLSLPFGVLAQVFRALRWRQMLDPMGERSRSRVRINAIFLSYATSLVVPRVGEFVRCGVLRRYDNVNYAKALGTVVTERVIDTLLIAVLALAAILIQLPVFSSFFSQTGTSFTGFLSRFTTAGWLVTAACALIALVFVWWLLRRLAVYERVKDTLRNLWKGIASVRNVRSKTTFAAYTLAIWLSYFFHYYLTFFCFDFTESLSLQCALVSFVVGSIAVIVPTPNGAGPWHFAVKTMLILYGVADERALYFVLIVHTVQTALVVLLGIIAWATMPCTDPSAGAAMATARHNQQQHHKSLTSGDED